MFTFPQLLLLFWALIILAMWLPLLFVPKKFKPILERILKNSDIVRVWAFLMMLIWFLFLSVYQKFDNGWAMIFPIFGYIELLKWLTTFRFPSWGRTKYKWFFSKPVQSFIMGILVILVAVFIAWVALMKI